MMHLLLYTVILVLFLGTCLYGIRFRNQPDALFELNRDTTNALRGYAILGVMIHHMVLKMSSASILLPFRLVGYLCVSLFFFLSGYGLYQAARKRGDAYTHGFLQKRLTAVYIPAVFAQFLYMVVLVLVFHRRMTVPACLEGLFVLYPLDTNQWYILAALYHYLMFWLSLKYLQKWKYRILLLLAAALAYLAFCVAMGLPKNWFDTSFCFVIGVAFAAYGRKAFFWLRRTAVVLPVLLAVFGMSVFLSYGKEDAQSLVFRCVSSITFVLLTLALMRIVDLSHCKAAVFLGSISLECYLMHSKAIHVLELQYGTLDGTTTVIYLLLTAALVCGFVQLMKCYRSGLQKVTEKHALSV